MGMDPSRETAESANGSERYAPCPARLRGDGQARKTIPHRRDPAVVSPRVAHGGLRGRRGCDSLHVAPIVQQPRPSSAAPQPLHRTTRLASLTSLNDVGVLLGINLLPIGCCLARALGC
jgi:hypothetical protein